MFFIIKSIGKILVILTVVSATTGCNPFSDKAKSSNVIAENNLDEKPTILNISASVIWDGSQSLGGNWISHPDVNSPERVLIKNNANGKLVLGAIFQQTKSIKRGSAIISSDAARALGISKNEETEVYIVAVRETKNTETTQKPVNTLAEKNIENKIKLTKPFIQVGIFGVENNATKTRDILFQLGVPINTFEFEIKGKPYWRVVAGPASTSQIKQNMLTTIKSAGFTDAYFVKN